MTYKEFKDRFIEQISAQYSSSEAEILFDIFLNNEKNWNRIELRTNLGEKITEIDVDIFEKIIEDLITGKPYKQILGKSEFYGLQFIVDEHVLIPRPETEELLELAITKIKSLGLHKKEFKILDIGTGSGIIPIVLKKEFPQAKVSALDFSENALKTAIKNAEIHGTDINFIHKDYLNAALPQKYDVIISNPPYIGIEEEGEISDSVKSFEPKMALFSPTSNTLIFYEKIAKDCTKNLKENGLVFLEINQKLGKETKDLFVDVLTEVSLMKDLSGNERFVWGKM
jgi:release factor glutamine methyltransferase